MDWYKEEIINLEKAHELDRAHPGIIFYGSSTIRLWNTLAQDFPEQKVTNLGFGGSTLAACVWFFERLMTDYQPDALIVYAGDNDLGDGRHPEEVFIFFQQLLVRVKKRFPNVPCYFISLKPSIARWHLIEQFKYTNNLIESEINSLNGQWKYIDIFKAMLNEKGEPKPTLFDQDGLHLSRAGYQIWKETVSARLS